MEFFVEEVNKLKLMFIVLWCFIYICFAKSDIVQTIHLLTLNNLLRVKVKVKNERKWFKLAFSYQYFVIFPRVWCQIALIFFKRLRYVVYETPVKKI